MLSWKLLNIFEVLHALWVKVNAALACFMLMGGLEILCAFSLDGRVLVHGGPSELEDESPVSHTATLWPSSCH